MRTIIIRSLVVFVSTVAAVGVLVWPWPAPEVDWRTPVEQALAKGDCKTAVVVADAAAGAGSAEAYEMLRGLVEGGKCAGQPLERAYAFDAFIGLYQPLNMHADEVYGLTDHDLGFSRHAYVSTALFLCASPYNGLRHIDSVALSDAVPASRGPVMAWHRFRRQTCLAALGHLAEQLVDAHDAPAHEVAYKLLSSSPLNGTPKAEFQFARLLLERAFVPDALREREGVVKVVRDLAWRHLEKAAEAGNVDAIRKTTAFLHEGRFRERDDAKAYFWILRQRRLGLPDAPIDIEIERALSEAERESARRREEAMWRGPSGDGDQTSASTP